MNTCQNCAAEIPAGHEVALRGKSRKDPTTVICSNCAADFERALQAETENPKVIVALLVGVVAALAASLIWYAVVAITDYKLGIIAVGVGWLIGQAVVFGSGRKRGPALQAISVGITIVAMALSEYLIVRHFVVEALTEEGYTDFALLLPLDVMAEIIMEGIKANPLTLVFWGIAIWASFSVPARRRLRRAEV
jgi:hypothetical protein